jgi:hypothetical protein
MAGQHVALVLDPADQQTQRIVEVETVRDAGQGYVHELTHDRSMVAGRSARWVGWSPNHAKVCRVRVESGINGGRAAAPPEPPHHVSADHRLTLTW